MKGTRLFVLVRSVRRDDVAGVENVPVQKVVPQLQVISPRDVSRDARVVESARARGGDGRVRKEHALVAWTRVRPRCENPTRANVSERNHIGDDWWGERSGRSHDGPALYLRRGDLTDGKYVAGKGADGRRAREREDQRERGAAGVP